MHIRLGTRLALPSPLENRKPPVSVVEHKWGHHSPLQLMRNLYTCRCTPRQYQFFLTFQSQYSSHVVFSYVLAKYVLTSYADTCGLTPLLKYRSPCPASSQYVMREQSETIIYCGNSKVFICLYTASFFHQRITCVMN